MKGKEMHTSEKEPGKKPGTTATVRNEATTSRNGDEMAPGERRKLAGADSNQRERFFETVILSHRDSLRRSAFQLTRNPTEAEDLVQKTLIRAFTRWHTFRAEREHSPDGGAARAWLQAILRNLFLSDLERQKRRRGREISLEEFSEDGGTVSKGAPLSSAAAMKTPEQATVTKEEFLAVRRAIGHLPETYSAVLAMAVEEGLLYDEIAVRLNLPIGTVRSRLHRARKRIQRAVSAWRIGVA